MNLLFGQYFSKYSFQKIASYFPSLEQDFENGKMSVFKIQKEFLLFKFKTCRYKKKKNLKRKEEDELYSLIIINNNKKK